MDSLDSEKVISKIREVWNEKNAITEASESSTLSLKVINQMASAFAAGEYYYYILNFESMEMEYVHDSIKVVLGIGSSEFNIAKLFELFHPDDLVRMQEKEDAACEFLFNRIAKEDIPFYKVVYMLRLRDENGDYKKILHQTKALTVSENGRVQQTLGVHTDVTYLNTPIDNKISFIGLEGRPSYFALDPSNMVFEKQKTERLFTKRETDVIALVAEGKTFVEIAEDLVLSEHTIKTHKKNILRKAEVKNAPQLIAYAIRAGII